MGRRAQGRVGWAPPAVRAQAPRAWEGWAAMGELTAVAMAVAGEKAEATDQERAAALTAAPGWEAQG